MFIFFFQLNFQISKVKNAKHTTTTNNMFVGNASTDWEDYGRICVKCMNLRSFDALLHHINWFVCMQKQLCLHLFTTPPKTGEGGSHICSF